MLCQFYLIDNKLLHQTSGDFFKELGFKYEELYVSSLITFSLMMIFYLGIYYDFDINFDIYFDINLGPNIIELINMFLCCYYDISWNGKLTKRPVNISFFKIISISLQR